MARITTRLKELRDADVRYISLVDRAATRIPFRILKRDEENSVDLTQIFKTDQKPEITAVVVRDGDEKTTEAVRKGIADAGFVIDKVSKSEDKTTLVYAQTETQPENVALVRLSNNLVLAVKGLGIPEGNFSQMAVADGFYSGVNMAFDVLHQSINEALVSGTDSKKIAADIGGMVGDFKDYTVALVEGLPLSAFKADVAIQNALTPGETPVTEETTSKIDLNGLSDLLAKAPKHLSENEWSKMSPIDKISWAMSWIQDSPPHAAPDYSGAGGGAKNIPIDGHGGHGSAPSITESKDQLAQPLTMGTKADTELTTLLKSIGDKVDIAITKADENAAGVKSLSEKIEGVANKQENQQKVVDDLIQKSDTLTERFKTTVSAHPTNGDVPALGEPVQKKDSDPRTGCFDTAFMPGRNRVTKASRY